MDQNRDLELLYEIGCLRFISRSWVQFLGPNFANLAEHHLRVTWLAMLLSKMEGKGDMEKIMKMALVHDVSESRTGDLHYIGRQYAKRDEPKAIADILKNTSLEKEMLELWHEYEERKTIESKIVKDADYLDVDLEIQEQKTMGREQMKVWDSNRNIIQHKLFTESAKKLWAAIKKSDPTEWYRNSRNRFTEGDMKPETNN
jgi:putative hydrolase of HD superfamily